MELRVRCRIATSSRGGGTTIVCAIVRESVISKVPFSSVCFGGCPIEEILKNVLKMVVVVLCLRRSCVTLLVVGR
jgi:hypothetical protein